MIEIRLPKPGPEIENATITTWERSQGDKILIGDILAIIKTPIGSFKVAAEEQGILEDVLQTEGASINFDEPIAILKPEIKISDFPEDGATDESTLPLPIEQTEPEAVEIEKEVVEQELANEEPEQAEESLKETIQLSNDKITLAEPPKAEPDLPPIDENPEPKVENEGGLKLVESGNVETPVQEEEAVITRSETPIEEKIILEDSVTQESINETEGSPDVETVEENIEEEYSLDPVSERDALLPDVSPAARKMAERIGIDLAAVQGTGDNGKILYIDVENAILEKEIAEKEEKTEPELQTVSLQQADEGEESETAETILEKIVEVEISETKAEEVVSEEKEDEVLVEEASVDAESEKQTLIEEETFSLTTDPEEAQPKEEEPSVANIPYPDYEEISVQFHLAKKDDLIIPFNTVKKAHSEAQSESNQTIPHFHLFAEVDFTEAEKWHADFNDRNGSKITLTDLMVKACGHALALMPEMNAFVRPDRIILKRSINIGITTSVDEGVVTPVVPDVYHKSLQKVSKVIQKNKDLAETSKVVLDYDTTFTITNLGEYGVKRFIPAVTAPQTATLGIGKVMRKVVPVADFFGIRSVLELTLSCDHRAIDGTAAARFIQTLTKDLESFVVGEDPDWIKGNEQLRLI